MNRIHDRDFVLSLCHLLDCGHGYIKTQIPNPKTQIPRTPAAITARRFSVLFRIIVATIFTSSVASCTRASSPFESRFTASSSRSRTFTSFSSRRTIRSLDRKSRSLDASSDSSRFEAAEAAAATICKENAAAMPPDRAARGSHLGLVFRYWLGFGIWVLGFPAPDLDSRA